MSLFCHHQQLKKKNPHCLQNNKAVLLWNYFTPFLKSHGQNRNAILSTRLVLLWESGFKNSLCFQARILKSNDFCSVVGTCNAPCERIFLTSEPLLRKWKSWKCVFVCWFKERVSKKGKKGCGILSRDRPSYEWGKPSEVLLYLHTWGNYKSPEVRIVSVVGAVIWTPAGFQIYSFGFLKTDRSL